MRNFFRLLGSYLVQNIRIIVSVFVVLGIFQLVFSLCSLPPAAVEYAALLSCVFILTVGGFSFAAFYRKHMLLDRLKYNIAFTDSAFPPSKCVIERDYQELTEILIKDRIRIISKKDRDFNDMMEYYTIWAHQIKTPISAMRLLLQSEPSPRDDELSEQLFKVEQYVDMALQYLRMESMSSDLLLKRYSLDGIVKQAVRKYSKYFIRKRIKLNYKEMKYRALTDEKWLLFVIEQVLSNALKYTNEGEISIYMEPGLPGMLVVQDTGIGIAGEDLPRVFERGFTGCNGRYDKKSTGIGLYLCKRILTKLSHTIEIESVVGKGTKVKIGIDTKNMDVE